jgi:intracellular septation protein
MYFLKAFRPIGLDMLSTIFFIGMIWLTRNIFIATGIGMAVGSVRFIYMKSSGRPIGALNHLGLVLILVTGITTLVTRNPIFVLLKPSIIKFAVGTFMLTADWLGPYLPPLIWEALSLRQVKWLARSWGLMSVGLGIAGACIAICCSLKIWSLFVSIVPMAAIIGMFCVQYLFIRIAIGPTVRARIATAASPSPARMVP